MLVLDKNHLDGIFPRLSPLVGDEPSMPAWVLTPDRPPTWHRFFDTSPISPSGRYMALTQVDDDTTVPKPGDPARVVLLDLQTGEIRTIATTHGWDTQLGAQVQWGRTDHQLLFNDVDVASWTPHGVCMDPLAGETHRLDGTVYMASPDGRSAASPCLIRIGLTQGGYGVFLPDERVPRNRGLPDDDGVTLTDLETGRAKLAFSLAELVTPHRQALDRVAQTEGGDFYAFHVKWSPDSARLMVVVRRVLTQDDGSVRMLPFLLTVNPDGSDSRLAVPADSWAVHGGHHPNWCPDGRVLINLRLPGRDGLHFVTANDDGSDLRIEAEGIPGSGHPTLHPNGRHILTDAYLHELGPNDGTAPLRLVDLQTAREQTLRRVNAKPVEAGPKRIWRVDQHPAWDNSFRAFTFNCMHQGVRSVAIGLPDLAE